MTTYTLLEKNKIVNIQNLYSKACENISTFMPLRLKKQQTSKTLVNLKGLGTDITQCCMLDYHSWGSGFDSHCWKKLHRQKSQELIFSLAIHWWKYLDTQKRNHNYSSRWLLFFKIKFVWNLRWVQDNYEWSNSPVH